MRQIGLDLLHYTEQRFTGASNVWSHCSTLGLSPTCKILLEAEPPCTKQQVHRPRVKRRPSSGLSRFLPILAAAAAQGHAEIVQRLLERGANPRIKDYPFEPNVRLLTRSRPIPALITSPLITPNHVGPQ